MAAHKDEKQETQTSFSPWFYQCLDHARLLHQLSVYISLRRNFHLSFRINGELVSLNIEFLLLSSSLAKTTNFDLFHFLPQERLPSRIWDWSQAWMKAHSYHLWPISLTVYHKHANTLRLKSQVTKISLTELERV